MADSAPAQHRFAIYLPSFGGGGAERAMVTLANGLAQRGQPVDLVAAKAAGPFLAEVDPAVRVIDLKHDRVIASAIPLMLYLRREKPSTMLSVMTHANLVAILARMLARSPVRLFVSERTSLTGLRDGLGPSRFAIIKCLMRLLYPRADGVLAVAEAMAADLRATFPLKRVELIHNPVVDDRLMEMSRMPPSHPWLLDRSVPVVLAAGRLCRAKDYATLLAAFARLRTIRPARLLIVGEGPERERLWADAERLGVSRDVAMPGFDDNPFALMSRACVFVLSSRYEGLPNALIQAMACGARVIATDCPTGPREVLEGGRWGRLVRIGDVEAMAEAMANALDDPTPPNVRERANAFSVKNADDKVQALMGD